MLNEKDPIDGGEGSSAIRIKRQWGSTEKKKQDQKGKGKIHKMTLVKIGRRGAVTAGREGYRYHMIIKIPN